jgi:hypothetical protein
MGVNIQTERYYPGPSPVALIGYRLVVVVGVLWKGNNNLRNRNLQ